MVLLALIFMIITRYAQSLEQAKIPTLKSAGAIMLCDMSMDKPLGTQVNKCLPEVIQHLGGHDDIQHSSIYICASVGDLSESGLMDDIS